MDLLFRGFWDSGIYGFRDLGILSDFKEFLSISRDFKGFNGILGNFKTFYGFLRDFEKFEEM